MRRILSTAFISCSHGEVRFLQSKKQESKKNRKQQSILGIESHRFQNQESESDSIPKISESYIPTSDFQGKLNAAIELIIVIFLPSHPITVEEGRGKYHITNCHILLVKWYNNNGEKVNIAGVSMPVPDDITGLYHNINIKNINKMMLGGTFCLPWSTR